MKRVTTALLGGSFNPAHAGHRHISLFAARALNLEEVWWMVSPGNPLKTDRRDMATLVDRLKSARAASRRSIIKVTAIEQNLGTRFTVDTLSQLVRRFPNRRFVWLMGADNLAQFHRWRDWRRIAALMPIAVIARPGYEGQARASRAAGALKKFVHSQRDIKSWTQWRPPALVLLRFRPDSSSATAIRRANPDWHLAYSPTPVRDAVTRLFVD
jgi:nicotinate-nucleotide adenylyltransferase